MDKLLLKKRIIEECISHQQKIADSSLGEMTEADESAKDYGNPEDWTDTFKTDMLNKRDVYMVQHRKAMEEISKLKLIDVKRKMESVAYGTVVFTDSQKLFISTGIGKLIVDKDEFFVISPSVPLFQVIRNLKKGSIFDFRGKKDKIKEVF
jgi:hypothetical protein